MDTIKLSGLSAVAHLQVVGRTAATPLTCIDLAVDSQFNLAVDLVNNLAVVAEGQWIGGTAKVVVEVKGRPLR